MNNKKLNILQVLPALESGGVERGTLEIAEYIVKKGHNSYVISSGGRLVKKLIEGGSKHFQLSIGHKSPFALFTIFKLLKIYKEHKIDVVHARSRLPAWLVFLSLKFIFFRDRPKFVTTIHGYNSISFYSSIMTKGDVVIIVSNALKNFIFKNYKINKTKVFVNHRGVEDLTKKFNQSHMSKWETKWTKENQYLKNKIILTLPARISRHKGIEDFIYLIKFLKSKKINIHGLIVGEANSKKYLTKLQKFIKANYLEDQISLLGYRSDIYEIMSISDITFSLSSLPEAFGRTVIESIKLGTPVIGYNHGGVGEQLKIIFPEGMIKKNNKKDLTKKTLNFIKNKPQVKKTTLFSLENMQKNTLNIYLRVMS